MRSREIVDAEDRGVDFAVFRRANLLHNQALRSLELVHLNGKSIPSEFLLGSTILLLEVSQHRLVQLSGVLLIEILSAVGTILTQTVCTCVLANHPDKQSLWNRWLQ